MKLWELLRLCMYLQLGLFVMSCGSSVFQVLETDLSQLKVRMLHPQLLCSLYHIPICRYSTHPGTSLILAVCRPIQCIQAFISHNCVQTYFILQAFSKHQSFNNIFSFTNHYHALHQLTTHHIVYESIKSEHVVYNMSECL